MVVLIYREPELFYGRVNVPLNAETWFHCVYTEYTLCTVCRMYSTLERKYGTPYV